MSSAPPPSPENQVRYTVAVASGKGGVGKSTVAVNLALALHQKGFQVGLVDADILGPTIGKMVGVSKIDQRTQGLPIEKFGIKIMSAAFISAPGQANILRGPMVGKYVVAYITQIPWGALDFLIIDLPPGTGDAQLSLCQEVPPTGALLVTMPQDVSLEVVRRGAQMFDQLKVPILGIVENMSYFTGDDGKRYTIFGSGGGMACAAEWNVPLLAQLPIIPQAAIQGDAGDPIVHSHPDSDLARLYAELAQGVLQRCHELEGQATDLPTLQL
jgi:ATP-binding protein involved in chromosome partitioning